jgi:hypothetical protein
VVFYRKHPGHEEQLQVRWIADLVRPAAALQQQPDLLRHVEAFDVQTDRLLRAFAGSFEELLAIERQSQAGIATGIPDGRVRAGLNNVLRTIFDVERTRGKVREWYSTVSDPQAGTAAQSLATVLRKIDFLTRTTGLPADLQGTVAGFDSAALDGLKGRMTGVGPAVDGSGRPRPSRSLRRLVTHHAVLTRLVRLDRSIVARLQRPDRERWLKWYSSLRRRVRSRLG